MREKGEHIRIRCGTADDAGETIEFVDAPVKKPL